MAALAHFFGRQPELPNPPTIASLPAPAPPPPVPFFIKAKVKSVWEQHLKLNAATSRGDAEPAETRIRIAVEDINERLLSDGVHRSEEILAIVRAAALEVGFNEGQTEALVAVFQANSSAAKSGAGGF